MRDDFDERTKRTLYDRVAGFCSNPECRSQTSGPSDSPTKAVRIGVAAHIAGAAPGGPRYDPAMSPDERGGIGNGIWLCQTCATMVDRDTIRFTPPVLRGWKGEAEGAARRGLGAGRPAHAQSVNAAVMIQGAGALQISGPNALNIAPGGIVIQSSVAAAPPQPPRRMPEEEDVLVLVYKAPDRRIVTEKTMLAPASPLEAALDEALGASPERFGHRYARIGDNILGQTAEQRWRYADAVERLADDGCLAQDMTIIGSGPEPIEYEMTGKGRQEARALMD